MKTLIPAFDREMCSNSYGGFAYSSRMDAATVLMTIAQRGQENNQGYNSFLFLPAVSSVDNVVKKLRPQVSGNFFCEFTYNFENDLGGSYKLMTPLSPGSCKNFDDYLLHWRSRLQLLMFMFTATPKDEVWAELRSFSQRYGWRVIVATPIGVPLVANAFDYTMEIREANGGAELKMVKARGTLKQSDGTYAKEMLMLDAQGRFIQAPPSVVALTGDQVLDKLFDIRDFSSRQKDPALTAALLKRYKEIFKKDFPDFW